MNSNRLPDYLDHMCAVLVDHAKAAYGLMLQIPEIDCAKRVWEWARRKEHFTGRDALEAVKGRFPTMEAVNAGLQVLQDRF